MSGNNIGAQLRRFVAICQSEADINTRLPHPLNRSPVEWQHLSDLLCFLLESCPPARSSILGFLHHILVAHFQAISSHQQPPMTDGGSPQKRRWQASALPSEAFILTVLKQVRQGFAYLLPLCCHISQVLNSLFRQWKFVNGRQIS